MKIHRFFGIFNLSEDRVRITDPDLAHQIHTVLKLRAGEEVVLCDGSGNEALAVLTRVERGSAEANIRSRRESTGEPTLRVTLCCAVLKRENFEFVAQKATEIGVTEIIPITTARTVKLGVRMDRVRAIVREAAEQSGRGRLPTVHEPVSLSAAFAALGLADVKLFFDGSGELYSSGQMIRSSSSERERVEKVALFIGPEGGWEPNELALAREHGCRIVSLGALTLRGETAAIIATYLAAH
jgi:16S rRNA (uracil1498-N3)-methyltransferase